MAYIIWNESCLNRKNNICEQLKIEAIDSKIKFGISSLQNQMNDDIKDIIEKECYRRINDICDVVDCKHYLACEIELSDFWKLLDLFGDVHMHRYVVHSLKKMPMCCDFVAMNNIEDVDKNFRALAEAYDWCLFVYGESYHACRIGYMTNQEQVEQIALHKDYLANTLILK